jgi:superfamily II DNA/RNA helicase
MDLFGRGNILLTGCSLLVIDEADRMLDMGFIPDIEEICAKLPKQRQTLLFSATMPAPIKKLADRFLDNPKRIEVARPASTNINITQWLVSVKAADKRERLRRLLTQPEVTNAIVFCNRKTTVRELNKVLKQAGFKSGEIHGDMEQPQRLAELELFKRGDVTILVASDVAARGLDIKGVSTVFNYDAPWHPDDYVHRIGRTGRAGATGTAYTFAAPDDAENIENIEKLTGQKIPRLEAESTHVAEPDAEARAERPRRGRRPERTESAAPTAPVHDVAPMREPVAERSPASQPQQQRDTRQEQSRQQQDRAPRRERQDERYGDRNDQRRDRYRRDERDDGPDEGWNGPIPEFLKVALVIQP